MKVVWRNRAISQRISITDFIIQNYGRNSARKFNADLIKCKKLISQNPDIAPVEPLLQEANKIYRSIKIDHINRLIYYVEGDVIFIVSIWDTRRCPDDIVNQV